MDRGFIRKYCESIYPELEVTAVSCNEKYRSLKIIFEKHESEFEKALNDHKHRCTRGTNKIKKKC